MRTILSILALLVCFALSSTSCVSKGKYQGVVSERDQWETKASADSIDIARLSAENAALTEERDELADMAAVEAAAIADLQNQADALRGIIAMDQVVIVALAYGIQITLPDDLVFSSGSVDLHSDGKDLLSNLAGYLAESPYTIDVVGNTDNVGVGPKLEKMYPTNWELAAARASRVAEYLQKQGVDPGLIEVISHGEYYPIATNDTPEGRAANRRVEVVLRPR